MSIRLNKTSSVHCAWHPCGAEKNASKWDFQYKNPTRLNLFYAVWIIKMQLRPIESIKAFHLGFFSISLKLTKHIDSVEMSLSAVKQSSTMQPPAIRIKRSVCGIAPGPCSTEHWNLSKERSKTCHFGHSQFFKLRMAHLCPCSSCSNAIKCGVVCTDFILGHQQKWNPFICKYSLNSWK